MAEAKLNNFQKLEEKQVNELMEFKPGISPKIESNVTGAVRTVGFMGDVLELYLPRVFDLFISLFGGKRDESISGQNNDGFTTGNQKPD